MEMKCLGCISKRWLLPTVSECFAVPAQLSSNPCGPLFALVMVQETVCSLNIFCSWNPKKKKKTKDFNMVILRILEWHLEDLALADVMDSHAAFLFMWLNQRANQRLCFNCSNYELVWNGNKQEVARLGTHGSFIACQIYSNCRFIHAIVFPNTDLLTFCSTCGELVTPVQ